MGAALWIAAGLGTFLVARTVPLRRTGPWLPELVVAILAAAAAGVIATALDFGGWNEPDWRSGLFALFVTAAALGFMRTVRR